MSLGSGLKKSFGYGPETTYGVPVAPTVFLPLVDESMSCEIARLQSKGVIAGARTQRSQQWAPGSVTAGGDTGFELYDHSVGPLLLACYGAVSVDGDEQTFVPGDLVDDFGTVQLNKPDVEGTDQPFTYSGAMVDEWQIACKVDEYATMGITWICRDEILYRQVTDGVTVNADATVTSASAAFGPKDVGKPISGAGIPAGSYIGRVNSATSIELSSTLTKHTSVNATASATGVTITVGTALTAVSYVPDIEPMSFLNGGVDIAGAEAFVKEITLTGKNGLAKARRGLGKGHIKQPLEAGIREYSGTMKLEFENLNQYNRYKDGVEFAIVFSIGLGAQELVHTLNARYDGKTPIVSGTDLGEIELPFTCLGPEDDAGAVSAVYTTTDAAPS